MDQTPALPTSADGAGAGIPASGGGDVVPNSRLGGAVAEQQFNNGELGGYRILRALTPDQSWLAEAPGGRAVVLKRLDDDCLWKNQLHPSIKDRLARVRELAHTGVANLYGVERDAGLVYLVWEHVPGRTLAEYSSSASCTHRDLLVLARELVLGVEMLHARGIIHGQLTGSNLIVREDGGRAVITHVSPLLYTEPEQDVPVLLGTFAGLLEARGERDTPFGHLIDGAAEAGLSLRQVAVRLGGLIEAREAEAGGDDAAEAGAGRRIRRRAVVGAVATAALGLAAFAALRGYARQHTPRPPVPPPAPAAALQSVTWTVEAGGAVRGS